MTNVKVVKKIHAGNFTLQESKICQEKVLKEKVEGRSSFVQYKIPAEKSWPILSLKVYSF